MGATLKKRIERINLSSWIQSVTTESIFTRFVPSLTSGDTCPCCQKPIIIIQRRTNALKTPVQRSSDRNPGLYRRRALYHRRRQNQPCLMTVYDFAPTSHHNNYGMPYFCFVIAHRHETTVGLHSVEGCIAHTVMDHISLWSPAARLLSLGISEHAELALVNAMTIPKDTRTHR